MIGVVGFVIEEIFPQPRPILNLWPHQGGINFVVSQFSTLSVAGNEQKDRDRQRQSSSQVEFPVFIELFEEVYICVETPAHEKEEPVNHEAAKGREESSRRIDT